MRPTTEDSSPLSVSNIEVQTIRKLDLPEWGIKG